MRIFKHADYVEYWNACEEASSAPYPIAIWDSRTGAVLTLSESARHTLRCDLNLPAYMITADFSLPDIFSSLMCGNTEKVEITFHLESSVTNRHKALIVFPTRPSDGRPIYFPVLPILLDNSRQAEEFAGLIANRLLAPEQPRPILCEFDILTEERASQILAGYSGQIYIKDLSRKTIASTPAFNAFLNNSRKKEVSGLDISNFNPPYARAIGTDLDIGAMSSGHSGAYAVPSRRVHDMLHTWRKIHRIPILAPSGQAIGLLLALRELYDVDLSRTELERYKRIFGIVHSSTSELPFIIFVWRDNGTAFIDYISKNTLRLGVSSYELQELAQLAALVHPDDRSMFWESREMFSKTPGETSYRLRLPDGSAVKVREHVERITGEGHYNWLISRLYVESAGENALASEAADRRVIDSLQRRQVFINQMSMDFNRTTNIRSAIQAALSHVCEDMGLQAGLLYEEHEGRITLAFQHEDFCVSPHAMWPSPTRRDLDEVAQIKRHDESLLTNDENLPEFCRKLKFLSGMDNVHVASIRDENETFGMLCFLDWGSSSEWTGREHEALSQYAHTLAGFICRKRSQGMLMRLAYVDPVLGIPNRAALEKDMTATGSSGSRGLIMTIELRNMSMVANSYGLSYGNAFLAGVCDFTCRYFPEASLYRISNNQFALLFYGWDTKRAGSELDGYFERFSRPWDVLDKQVFGMAAAGIASLSECPDPEEAIRQADVALEDAVTLGHSVYDGYKVSGLHQVEILAALHEEASKNFVNMTVHYQPIFSLETQRFCAVEALVRWSHPAYGSIRPDAFIDLAEQSGLIVPLTFHVLKESLAQIRRWRDRGIAGISVNVNASPRFLRDQNVVEQILHHVEAEGLMPGMLTIELTESMAIQNTDITIDIINRLRRKGIKVAFDDFGVGYSSLYMLRNIPLDVVKIDKSFLKVCADFDQIIIGFAVDAARLQNMQVCAEGVETAENWQMVERLGVTLLQGYYLSRPAPADAIEPLLLDPKKFLSRPCIGA